MKSPRWLALLALLAFASPAEAQDARLSNAVLIAAVAAHGADLATTAHCLGSGRCREGNPLLKPFADRPVALGAVKAGVVGSMLLLKLRYRREHPKLVFWLSVAETVAVASVAVKNGRR